MLPNKKMGLIDPQKWAQNVIDEYIKNNDFDPFRILENKDRDTKIYSLCCDFLAKLENAKNDITKQFINDLNEI